MKIKFFPTAIALLAVAGAAYASKKAIDQNGGVEPTIDKVRDGATSMINKAKKSSMASAIMGIFSSLRSRIGGSNDNFVGEVADEQQQVRG